MTDEQFFRKLGARIQEYRGFNGWSGEDLSMKIGVSRMQINRIENGKTHTTISVLRRLAKVFEIPLTRLLDVNGPI